ncbi:MAG: hypothetical protein ACWA5L_09865 [bacterium]
MTKDNYINKPALGLLCWKGYSGFRHALQSYQAAGVFELFGEKLIWFQEIDDEARALASDFGLPYAGSEENLGIAGGFQRLATALSSPVITLLENDLPLIEPRQEAERQLAIAYLAIRSQEVAVFRLRHRQHPGQKFTTLEKYQRYYRPELSASLRRFLRPGKARRLAGTAIYAEKYPEKKFPELIEKTPAGWYKVSSRCLPWTNQSIMVRRDFFLNTIIDYALSSPSSRSVNGFPDIEKEWNNPKWRNSGWTIGADKGLFTHERI